MLMGTTVYLPQPLGSSSSCGLNQLGCVWLQDHMQSQPEQWDAHPCPIMRIPGAAWVKGRCLVSSEAPGCPAVRDPTALSIIFRFVPSWRKATQPKSPPHIAAVALPNGNFSPNSLIVFGGWNPTSSPLADFPYVSGEKKKKAAMS